jgi:hypothetical protein
MWSISTLLVIKHDGVDNAFVATFGQLRCWKLEENCPLIHSFPEYQLQAHLVDYRVISKAISVASIVVVVVTATFVK